MDERVDRGADLRPRGGERHILLRDRGASELVAARFQRLGEAVEHLAAVVRRPRGPAALRAARGLDRVADVLARRARDVADVLPGVVGGRVAAAGLRARALAAQVELVRLGDDGAAAHVSLTYGSRPDGPPSRPKPLSL